MNTKDNSRKLTPLIRTVLVICAALLITILFYPIWKIDFTAPQYPEGLILKIWADKLTGNVETINGLNHYIGMRHLHQEDFLEFTILPWLIIGYAILSLIVIMVNKKKFFYAYFWLFVLFAVVSMVDFYRWEYQYGHELNPDAPIQVPGMSYQPPLIGYKKLLNFGVYSIPDIGGWIFITVGVLLGATAFFSWRSSAQKKKTSPVRAGVYIPLLLLTVFSACTESGPKEIRYGKDDCAYCKMSIVDERFAVQAETTKGKNFKFDDAHCALAYIKKGGIWRTEVGRVYFADYSNKGKWIEESKAIFLESEALRSPMGGNYAAFSTEADFNSANEQFKGEKLTWQDLDPTKK